MGGFTILRKDGRQHPFVLHDLQKHLAAGDIKIIKEEIEDRSKGDLLSKGIVLIQTGWFILQLIARAIQHLPITELEPVALAFAILNFTTYGVWWNKPLDVQCPVVVIEVAEDVNEPAAPEIDQCSVTPPEEPPGSLHGTQPALPRGLFTLSHSRSISVKEVVKHVFEAVSDVFLNLVYTGDSQVEVYFVDMQRVPTFYWGIDLGDELYWTFQRSVNGFSILVATVLGAIHCIAWSFQMPGEVERMLWRIAAAYTTVSPLPFATMMGGFNLTPEAPLCHTMRHCLLLRQLIILGPPLLYIAARMTLLAQAFALLRALPAGAYATVRWTTFIPHI
jgi:hypothetical protein